MNKMVAACWPQVLLRLPLLSHLLLLLLNRDNAASIFAAAQQDDSWFMFQSYQTGGTFQQISAHLHPSGYIISHSGYGRRSYPDSISATVTLTDLILSKTDMIVLQFENFDVDGPSTNICYDYLQVNELVYCGLLSSTVSFQITANTFRFFFRTDAVTSHNFGFKIKYTVATSFGSEWDSTKNLGNKTFGYIVSHENYPSGYANPVSRLSEITLETPRDNSWNIITINFMYWQLNNYWTYLELRYKEAGSSGDRTQQWKNCTLNLDYSYAVSSKEPIKLKFYKPYSGNDSFFFSYNVTSVRCSVSALSLYDSIASSSSIATVPWPAFDAVCGIPYLQATTTETLSCDNGLWIMNNQLQPPAAAESGSPCFHRQNAQVIQIGSNLNTYTSTYEQIGYVLSHSPSPSQYKNNIDSTLNIDGLQSGQQIKFVFFSFDVGRYTNWGNCWQNSFLEIAGVSNSIMIPNIPILLCNTNNYKPNREYTLRVTQSTVTLRFRTQYNWSGNGFYLSYSVSGVQSTLTTKTTTMLPSTSFTTTEAIRSTTKHHQTNRMTGFSPTSSSNTVETKHTEGGDIISTATSLNFEGSTEQMMTQNVNNGITIGAVAGAVLLVLVVGIILVIVLLRRRRHTKSPAVPAARDHEQYFLNSDDNHLNGNASVRMSELNSATDDADYHYLPEGTAVSDNVYNMAEEETPIPAPRANDYDMAGQVSDQTRGGYDMPDDEYQLAGATEDEYENFTSIQRAEDEREITEDYAPIRASNKKKKTTTELIDNDLYGT